MTRPQTIEGGAAPWTLPGLALAVVPDHRSSHDDFGLAERRKRQRELDGLNAHRGKVVNLRMQAERLLRSGKLPLPQKAAVESALRLLDDGRVDDALAALERVAG